MRHALQTFVTRKITRAVAAIKTGQQVCLLPPPPSLGLAVALTRLSSRARALSSSISRARALSLSMYFFSPVETLTMTPLSRILLLFVFPSLVPPVSLSLWLGRIAFA